MRRVIQKHTHMIPGDKLVAEVSKYIESKRGDLKEMKFTANQVREPNTPEKQQRFRQAFGSQFGIKTDSESTSLKSDPIYPLVVKADINEFLGSGTATSDSRSSGALNMTRETNFEQFVPYPMPVGCRFSITPFCEIAVFLAVSVKDEESGVTNNVSDFFIVEPNITRQIFSKILGKQVPASRYTRDGSPRGTLSMRHFVDGTCDIEVRWEEETVVNDEKLVETPSETPTGGSESQSGSKSSDASSTGSAGSKSAPVSGSKSTSGSSKDGNK